MLLTSHTLACWVETPDSNSGALIDLDRMRWHLFNTLVPITHFDQFSSHAASRASSRRWNVTEVAATLAKCWIHLSRQKRSLVKMPVAWKKKFFLNTKTLIFAPYLRSALQLKKGRCHDHQNFGPNPPNWLVLLSSYFTGAAELIEIGQCY